LEQYTGSAREQNIFFSETDPFFLALLAFLFSQVFGLHEAAKSFFELICYDQFIKKITRV
jgi:hypothetical protein